MCSDGRRGAVPSWAQIQGAIRRCRPTVALKFAKDFFFFKQWRFLMFLERSFVWKIWVLDSMSMSCCYSQEVVTKCFGDNGPFVIIKTSYRDRDALGIIGDCVFFRMRFAWKNVVVSDFSSENCF